MWFVSDAGVPNKSGVIVEFSDLAFHLRSPGDLSTTELDEIVDFLTNFLNDQERNELFQLQHLYNTLYRWEETWSLSNGIVCVSRVVGTYVSKNIWFISKYNLIIRARILVHIKLRFFATPMLGDRLTYENRNSAYQLIWELWKFAT